MGCSWMVGVMVYGGFLALPYAQVPVPDRHVESSSNLVQRSKTDAAIENRIAVGADSLKIAGRGRARDVVHHVARWPARFTARQAENPPDRGFSPSSGTPLMQEATQLASQDQRRPLVIDRLQPSGQPLPNRVPVTAEQARDLFDSVAAMHLCKTRINAPPSFHGRLPV